MQAMALTPLLLLLCSTPFLPSISEAQEMNVTEANGLSFDFYKKTCPSLESIVRSHMTAALRSDIGNVAGLLRIFFHDCFVQGCDASVLLTGSSSEQSAVPNQTLRPNALAVINDLRNLIESKCGRVVSCADITVLATRDAVLLSGGPQINIPLGRRDSLKPASVNTVNANLPSPLSTVTDLLDAFKANKLGPEDLVALSGAHTVGVGHCNTFTNRLFPTVDPTMDPTFAKQLQKTCPTSGSPNTQVLDIQTPNIFDNKYYVNLVNRRGVFTSDQGLFGDSRTKPIVQRFAADQQQFFTKFADAMVKLSQLGVLTGSQGEIRKNCAKPNSARLDLLDDLLATE
ncbi:peroxidase 12-like [Typha latifolia]|uniref:peroxidase 12-like n=1 Tax=Typha latifolia TaxID=4733 RepID=UPI003C2D9DFE